MTPAERGDLAERLLPIAAGLACIVHGDGDQRDIAHILQRLDQQERDALLIVLAGLVDPDMPVTQALAFITWDEYGMPLPTAAPNARPSRATQPPKTIRQIATHPKLPSDLIGFFAEERETTARIRYHQLGHHQSEIARDFGVNERTVGRWLARSAA